MWMNWNNLAEAESSLSELHFGDKVDESAVVGSSRERVWEMEDYAFLESTSSKKTSIQ